MLGAYEVKEPLGLNDADIPKGLAIFDKMDPDIKAMVNGWKSRLAMPGQNPFVAAALKVILDGFEEIGNIVHNGVVDYLNTTYDEMWDVSSYYTGNLRGSLDIVGDIKNDPLNTDIDVNLDEFLRPKTLKNLHSKTYNSTWKLKDGTKKSKAYTQKAGSLNVKVGGKDYRDAQEYTNITSRQEVGGDRIGGPFIYTVWEEIKNKNRAEYM